METFVIEISYNQLAIFPSSLNDPFNDWTDVHISQGFTWRNNSVSFEILENGPLEIKIVNTKSFNENVNSIRIIRVPFTVNENNIEIASISDSKIIILEKSEYSIYFSLLPNNKCEICFIKEKEKPKIFKMIDKPIPEKLLMSSNSA